MKVTSVFLMITMSLSMQSPAHSASFDCGGAKKPIDQMICTDKELSDKDTNLGDAYAKRLARDSSVRYSERAWILSRDRACGVPAVTWTQSDLARIKPCLLSAIGARIKELETAGDH